MSPNNEGETAEEMWILIVVQGDQNVSVHVMITIQNSDAQRFFDQPVDDVGFSTFGDCEAYCLLRCGALRAGRNLPTLPPPPPSSVYKTAVAVPVRSP